MERRVHLFLRSRQRLDGSSEHFSQRAEGLLRETAEGIVLRYREEDGEASLRFAGDTVELRRAGTHLVFRAGETTPGRYAAPWGTLALSVRTDCLRHSVTMAGGRALLRYELLSGDASLGVFALTMQITAPRDAPPKADCSM